MTFHVNTRFGHLDRMPRCVHGRIEGYCSVCPAMEAEANRVMELAAAVARRVEAYGDRLNWGTRELALLPVEIVRPTGVDSWVVRVPGVEREFVITGEEYASCDTRRMAETGNTDSVPQGTGGAVPSEAQADAQTPNPSPVSRR